MRIVHIIRTVGAIVLMFALAVLIYLHFTPYHEFVNELGEYFRAKQVKRYIPQSKYDQWIVLPVLLSLLSVSVIIWARNVSRYLRLIKFPSLKIGSFWSSLNPEIRIAFILLLIINFSFRLYLSLTSPISYDEAWTFLHFSSKGFFTSLAYYPLPNNHILHSLLTNVSYYLPFEQTLNLRLPAIFINLIACMALFFSFSKLLSPRIGLILLLLFSFLFPVIYYGYHSRGYSLILLAFIICFYASIQLLKNEESDQVYKHIFYFILGGITGLYTMPSFLYAIIALAIFTMGYYLIQSQYVLLKKYIVGLLSCGVIVFLLYCPAILVSGWDSLSGNEFVRPVERKEVTAGLIEHFSDTSLFLFNTQMWATVTLVLALFLFLIINNYRRKELLLSVFVICLSPLLLIAHSVIPFPRSWIYLIIPVLYVIGIFLNYFTMTRMRWRILMTGSILVASLSYWGAMKKVKKTEQFSHKAVEAANYLEENQAEKVYSLHPLIHINLDYLFKKDDRDIEVEKIRQLPSELSFSSGSHSRNYLVTDKSSEKKGLKEVKNIDRNVFIYSLE